MTANTDHRDFSSPPGGLMVWIFISAELLTFGAFFGAYAFSRAGSPELYVQSQMMLNTLLATVNTLILVTSSFFVVRAVAAIERNRPDLTVRWLTGASILGLSFLVLKAVEYGEKFAADITMGTSSFFMFYYFLTFMHFLHVVLGVVILIALIVKVLKKEYSPANTLGLKTGACYWHMCDLIWVLLFPLLYLVP